MMYGNNLDTVVEPQITYLPMDIDEDLPYLQELNFEQRMAHNIIIHHLNAVLANKKPLQLLMNIISHGCMGKLTLLNVISTSFTPQNVSQSLAKTVMSGVATSLIGGTTLHWWAGLPARNQPKRENWMDCSS